MTKDQDDEARWKWVLGELAKCMPGWDILAVRYEEPDDFEQLTRHIAWLTREGPTCGELDGESAKAMRWACFAQGAMVALGWVTLAECKRLNMRSSWNAARDAVAV